MATFAEIGALADPSTEAGQLFAVRVSAALYKAAHNVLNESPTTNDRRQWASSVLEAGANSANVGRFVRYTLGNATIQGAGAAATDGDIEFVVNSLVTTLVGAQS